MAHVAPSTHPDYAPHFAAIGRVAEVWAQLEFTIDTALWEFANVEQMFGACITAQLMGVHGRLRALSSLLQARNAPVDLAGAVRSFAGSLSELVQKRNRAVHDPRMVNKAAKTMDRLEITASNKLIFEFRPESVDSLEATRAEIAAKVHEFKAIHEQTRAALNALPDTEQPILRRIVPVHQAKLAPATEGVESPPPPPPSRA